MSTFEEDLVDVYYNLNNYFTIRNIPFSSVNKNKGGIKIKVGKAEVK